MSPLLLLAIPEAENVPDGSLAASVREMSAELGAQHPVDWDEDLARGGGPCLALGAERRASSR
jgi:hypothetical protein